MNDQKKVEITGKINKLRKEMRGLGPVMRGSVTIMGKRHKQPYFSVGIQIIAVLSGIELSRWTYHERLLIFLEMWFLLGVVCQNMTFIEIQ